MRMSLREISKTLFLVIAALNLGVSSELLPLGILFAIGFVYLHFRLSRPAPRYKKRFAYGAILPFAIWWVLTPGNDSGFTPEMVFIPAWYLMFLAWLQKRSLGAGGFEAFVIFDGVAALLLGTFQAGRVGVFAAVLGLLLVIFTYSRPRTAPYKYLLFLLMLLFLGGSTYGGWQYWKNHRSYGSRWAKDYYERNRVLGFDPVVSLGSFADNYQSRFNSQVVLRVWDGEAPEYLRAAVYEKYVGGFWRLPAAPVKKLYPAYYQIDYPVFEKADSSTRTADVKRVWVQSAIDNFGFLFAPEGAMGVSVKNADSLDYYQTDIVAGTGGKQKDWYYFVRSTPNGFVPEISLLPVDSSSLQLSEKQRPFVDSVANEMGVFPRDSASAESDAEYVKRSLHTIRNYFVQNFKYSLVIPKMSEHRSEPLRAFWQSREGFCTLYATMSVLVLRHRGIHARYVSGFAQPERVSGRDYVLYRRHHSHAWVEVFVDGRWYSFDPTPPSLRKIFASPSGWQSWWEGVRGRMTHWFHLLKEGQWRSVVDSWQAYTQNALESPWTYLVPGLIVLVLLVFRGLRRFKGRSAEVSDARTLEWARKLERTEKSLKRLGYVREPGETVGHFLVRLEQRMGSDGVDANRLLPLVKALRDYEGKRWR